MLDRFARGMHRSPPVTGRYVCPACLRARDAPSAGIDCAYRGLPIDREADEFHGAVVSAGPIPWWGWGAQVASMGLWALLFAYCAIVGGVSVAWTAGVVANLALGGYVAIRLWQRRLRKVRVGPDGIEQIDAGRVCASVRWSEVEECRARWSPHTLRIRGGAATIHLDAGMPGHEAARRGVLARTPVLTPAGTWLRPVSPMTGSTLAIAAGVVVLAGMIVAFLAALALR